jgi:isocitrate lyase
MDDERQSSRPEDQLSAMKKCAHMGGKVLVPTQEDVIGVPTMVLAHTDSEAANLLTADVDTNDKPYLTGERTNEGFYCVKNGLEQAISRGLAYAPYADLVWSETGRVAALGPIQGLAASDFC